MRFLKDGRLILTTRDIELLSRASDLLGDIAAVAEENWKDSYGKKTTRTKRWFSLSDKAYASLEEFLAELRKQE